MSDDRSVFISHSGKDSQTEALDASSGEQERWKRLQYARKARDAIRDGLAKQGYKVLLDIADLRPGDHWRAELHSWLGMCDGAVVLLDEDSVESEWVRKEATILSWRAQLGSRLRLIPVILPGFHLDQLEEAGLEPLRLDETQAVTARADEDPVALGERVAKLFGDLAADTADTPMQRWVEDVAHWLGKTDDRYLHRAAGKLGVTREELGEFNDRSVTLAHHLLHVGVVPALNFLREVKKGLAQEQFCRLVALVTPGWVSEESAQHLHAVLSAGRAPLLTVDDSNIGGDFLRRAYCSQLGDDQVITFADKVGEQPEEALQHLECALGEIAGLPPGKINSAGIDHFLKTTYEAFGPSYFYALVGPGSVRMDVFAVLAERFGASLRLVLLGGPDASENAEAWGAELVRPRLSVEAAQTARDYRALAEHMVAT